MKSIRIGNDIRIEWPIVLSGDVSKLQDLDLTVEVRPSAKIIDTHNYADEIRNNDNKRLLFEKHETTVMMNGGLECRRDIGDGKEHCRPRPPRPCPPRPIPPAPVKLPYHIEDNTLIAMWTADRQFATGDYDIILYAHKNEGGQAVCDQYRFVRLVSHTAQADAPDDSGIEAVIAMQPVTLELSGLSAYEVAVINGFQGTEEEWLASLKKPAEDAAEELKQEIEQFKEDTKEELQADIKAFGYYEDNPEFIRVYTDADGKFLWGIRIDGSIEWAKGVPTPIKAALKELADKIKDLGGEIDDVETALNDKIEALQDAIDVINASLKTLTDTFSYQDNPEFVNVVTDADGKVLLGIKTDGSPYYPNNEMYHVIQNDEYLAAWVDASNKLLFGIKTDGSIYIAKSEYIDAVKEIHEKLKGIEAVTENFEVTENPEFIAATTDSEGKVLEATKADGTKYFSKQALLDKYDDVEGRTEMTIDAEDKVLAYRDKSGIKHEEKLALNEVYDKDNNKLNLATKEDVEEVRNEIPNLSDINISELDGVEDHSLVNLFNKDEIRTYDSDFADKVFTKIGRKTAETGCYSNNIEAKEGDWFTRNDFGTGIIVALDENENILGDVANAAYQPTVQIVPSDPSKYDFSTMKYVVFVVMLENLDSERIVKAKYMPTGEGDYLTIPKLRVMSDNMDKDVTTYIKSSSGRYYQLQIDDSGESPILTPVALEGIPDAELPSNFPTFQVSGDFSQYYDGLVFNPIEGGVTEYLYELAKTGLVKRYSNDATVKCPRVLKEDGTWYYYGGQGGLNSSSAYLKISKANEESFEVIKRNIGDSQGNKVEPHDLLVLSVNPLHYIVQKYVPNVNTEVSGQGTKVVTALHVEEIYEGTSVWEWHSEDYGELWLDSHVRGNNADYLHNNSISVGPDGSLYLNNKHANQILVIERTWNEEQHTGTIGDILWKIGGDSDRDGYDVPTRIKTTPEQQWYESHDGVIDANGLITMYDNRASGPSRILEFKIDTENKVLTNFKSYTWQQYRGRYMGSAQKCAEGVYLVSWGSTRGGGASNAGIYDFNNNRALFEIRFDATGSSAYRVYGIPKGQE